VAKDYIVYRCTDLLDVFWDYFFFHLACGMGVRLMILKQLLHPIFLLLVGVFLAHQVLQYYDLSTPFLRSYLDDVLAIPVLFYLSQTTLRVMYKSTHLQLDWGMQITGMVLLVVVLEWIMPQVSSNYTRDGWDVLAYAIGWAGWILWKP
jgi:uncharacterized membrane protein